MSKSITVEIPDDALNLWETESKLARTLSQLSVVELVREGKLSAGKAREFLGISRWALMDLLAHHDVPTANFSKEEVDQQMIESQKPGKS